MSTGFEDIFAALAAPFGPGEVKTRSQGGRQLDYITARSVMNRFDNVVGPENWENEFSVVCDCLVCKITITLPDGRRVSKMDAGGFKEMTTREGGQVVTDEENTDKTGFSDALKRCAVLWGVGRHLYKDGVPEFAGGTQPQRAQQRPQQPTGAARERQAEPNTQNGGPKPDTPGRRFYKWLADEGKKLDAELVRPIQDWGKRNNAHGKIIDWSEPVCMDALKEAKRLIAEIKSRGDAYEEALAN